MAAPYKYIEAPNHPGCNSAGFYYEHIIIIEKELGRFLTEEECVHHIDNNGMNNTRSNLLLMTKKEHARLHAGYTEVEVICPICENTFNVSARRQGYRPRIHCSEHCADIASRKVDRPSKEKLELDVKSMSMVAIGKKYGVSDNAVRKWIKSYKTHESGSTG